MQVAHTHPFSGLLVRLGARLSKQSRTTENQVLIKSTATLATGQTEQRRILVLCLGGIGDTVLAFAALRDLRRACPDDHITALAMWTQSRDLLLDLGIFDEVLQHNFQTDRLWKSAWRAVKLWFKRFDVSLIAFPANRFEYNLLSWLLGARERWGHRYIRGSNFANLRFLLTHHIVQRPGRHVVDENRDLVAAFLGTHEGGPAEIRLGPIDPNYHHDAEEIFGHLSRPLLGVHAGCSVYKGLDTKRWPIERFAELCRRSYHELGLQPVIFGAPEELKLKHQIQSACPQVFFAHGETIRHTAALIAQCDAFVSNDSALAHIAAAVDVPVVMICGPTDVGEVRPYGTGQVLGGRTPCSPCFRVGRVPMCCTNQTYQACLKSITVAEVLAAVEDCLPRPRPASHGLGLLPYKSEDTNSFALPVLVTS